MKITARLLLALALLIPGGALAADPNIGVPVVSAGRINPVAVYCTDANGNVGYCNFGSGGGGGGGTASTVAVSNFPATQAVSASALPLPSGASTAAKQDSLLNALGSPLQQGGSVAVSNFPSTQAVSLSSAPLPSGAATDAKLQQIITTLGSPFQQGSTVSVGAPSDQTGSGSLTLGTANATYVVTYPGATNTVAFTVTGLTGSGATLVSEGSNDGGTTWTNAFSVSGATGVSSNSFTSDGQFAINTAGRTRVRLRVATAGSGTATIATNASQAVREVTVYGSVNQGGNWSVGLTGSLPAYASTPTFNIGTAPNLTLTNTAFGISGQLPSFAATPTFNIGTAPTITVTQSGPVTLGGSLPAYAATPTFNLGTGGLGASGSPIYTTAATPVSGATGSPAPANATQFGGIGPSGNLRAVAVSTSGGILPGQALPTTTITSVAANTVTTLDTARSTRLFGEVQLETSPTAVVYLCFGGQSNCSATVHDKIIASGAAVGAIYPQPFATTTAVTAYSTAAVTINYSSWLPQ